MQAACDRARQRHGIKDEAVKDGLGLGTRRPVPESLGWFVDRHQCKAANHRHDGQVQRRDEPDPDFQVSLGQIGGITQNRSRDDLDERLGQERRHPDAHNGNDQQPGRPPEAKTGIMRRRGKIAAHRAEEGVADEAEAVGGREQRADRGEGRHQPGGAEEFGIERFLQHHLLGHEPVEQRYARQRQRAQRGDDESDRHQSAQPAQPADVTGSGLVVNDARGHEEGGLEGRVIEDVEHRDQCAKGRACAQQHGDQAQLADRREGQERLEVVLEQRDHRAQNHGDQPRRGDDHEPFRRAGQDRPKPRQQENARLHHRGRVQIGGHGCRRGHGVRQPEVERELCRFGETAQQDQQERRHIERRGLDGLAVLQDVAEVVAARDVAQDQHSADQRKPARTGHSQRHARTLAAFGQVFPIADQQEGRQRCQLPEDQQKQDVVRQDDPHHRALKEQQVGEEFAHVIVA